MGSAEELMLTPARDDIRTTGFSKHKIIESAQRPNSPRALMLVNATQHGLLTTESEIQANYEETKIRPSNIQATINTEARNYNYDGRNNKNGTPYQGQG